MAESSDDEGSGIFEMEGDDEYFDDSLIPVENEHLWMERESVLSAASKVEPKGEVLDNQQIILKQRREVMEVAGLLSISEAEAMKLCLRHNWKIDQLLEKFFENGDDNDAGSSATTVEETMEEAQEDCMVCTDSLAGRESWRNPTCSPAHTFCADCWRFHIDLKIKEGMHMIPCMASKCPNTINDSTVIQKFVSPETFKLYEYLIAKAYVLSHKHTRWCPNPECKKAVYSEDTSISVTCDCGTRFCLRCGNESHSPVGCDMLRQWQEKLVSDGTSMEWVLHFSKPCPNPDCQMPIQKNGGCQFMTCSICKNPFCWECMTLLSRDHEAHKCEKKEEKDKDQLAKSQNELQDYSRCVQGFDDFMKRGKTLQNMRPEEARKQREYDYLTSDSFSNHRFYEDALDVLIDSFWVAKYSFVFQFFSRDNPTDLELFHFNQKALVEELKVLETILKRDVVLEKDKQDLGEKTRVVKIRTQTLIRSVEEGLTRNADLYCVKSS